MVIRPACFASNRSRTSSGNAFEEATGQRNRTLLLTLFTFCPPGPELLVISTSNSPKGIRIERLMMRASAGGVGMRTDRL